jgi:hypothetical protein
MQKKYKLTALNDKIEKVFSVLNIDAKQVMDLMVGRENFTFKIETIK